MIPDKDLTDDVLDEIIAGAKTSMEQYLALSLKAERAAGNSPVIPDGYVMVPKEPTKEMIDAGWLYFMGAKNPSSKGAYKAMLAAAPHDTPALNSVQSVVTVPGKWIPVSERIPEPNKFVLVSNGVWVGQGLYDDSEHLESDEHWQNEHREFINVLHHPVTHWMPLDAAASRPAGGARWTKIATTSSPWCSQSATKISFLTPP